MSMLGLSFLKHLACKLHPANLTNTVIFVTPLEINSQQCIYQATQRNSCYNNLLVSSGAFMNPKMQNLTLTLDLLFPAIHFDIFIQTKVAVPKRNAIIFSFLNCEQVSVATLSVR